MKVEGHVSVNSAVSFQSEISRNMRTRKTDQGERDPSPLNAKGKRKRRSRLELMPEAKEQIFEGAARVVGQHGYIKASMKRIAEAVGKAEGTIYLYFPSRQALFDELLPYIGRKMLRFIRSKIVGSKDIYEMEERGFVAFFEFVNENPGFFRVLNEAETAAPSAHKEHFRYLSNSYSKALRKAVRAGQIRKYSQEEIEAISYILLGARSYLGLRYFIDGNINDEVIGGISKTYMKIVRHGLRQQSLESPFEEKSLQLRSDTGQLYT
jgi:AcrR family transcriptional regulator